MLQQAIDTLQEQILRCRPVLKSIVSRNKIGLSGQLHIIAMMQDCRQIKNIAPVTMHDRVI